MDLTGTERLHRMSPALSLARFARRVEETIGITVSIGLSANKFLAKIASDLDKPRGFAVLGRDEAVAFLATKPVGFIWGVGKVAAARLERDGFRTVADLQRADETDLMKRYGVEGRRLWRLSRGIDDRFVNSERETKSVSAETTFSEDIASYKPLEKLLWSLSERVSSRLKNNGIAGSTITLKLKTADFRLRTRARSLGEPTQLAARIFEAGRDLLAREIDGTSYRLIGIGASNLTEAEKADAADLIDQRMTRSAQAEHAVDKVREKFGKAAMVKGLVFDGTIEDDEDEETTTSRPR
jgi:DNA polymerase-4